MINRENIDTGVGYTMVSLNKTIRCTGQVTQWTYQGHRSGSFRAIIFRPVLSSDNQFHIVGINDIPAGPAHTPVVYTVPEADRITVEEGDLMGWSFNESVIVMNGGGTAKVKWTNQLALSDLATNQTVDIPNGNENREYSIQATVSIETSTYSYNLFGILSVCNCYHIC